MNYLTKNPTIDSKNYGGPKVQNHINKCKNTLKITRPIKKAKEIIKKQRYILQNKIQETNIERKNNSEKQKYFNKSKSIKNVRDKGKSLIG